MVASARAPVHAGRLRALNAPRPVTVQASAEGEPVAVRLRPGGDWQRLTVQERWRIDDEWWREPIERHYFAVALPQGARLCLYHDALTGEWWVQGG